MFAVARGRVESKLTDSMVNVRWSTFSNRRTLVDDHIKRDPGDDKRERTHRKYIVPVKKNHSELR